MRVQRMPSRTLLLLLGAVAVAFLVALPGLARAQDSDPRLQEAVERTRAAQVRLDEIYQRLHAVEAEVEDLQRELAALQAEQDARREQAVEANRIVALRLRESYMRGTADPTFALLASGSVDEAREQSRLLGMLALRSRSEFEAAGAARVRTRMAADEVEAAVERLQARRAEVEALREEAAAVLAAAQAEELRVREVIAAEERARREREERERREREERERRERERRAAEQRAADERAARERTSRSQPAPSGGGQAVAAAAPSGGIACPVGQPRSYSDTWGAPRSGGRRHMGTDIMAPRGTPIYAYENGVVTRMNSNRLGGISLYLRGDSGNLYYYTHLQGYVSGLSPGQRVGVGQHIAFNGDTGNARGIPHLHFEVKPGGGGSVNPYPYVRRACG